MRKKDLAAMINVESSLQDIMQMLSPQEQEELKDGMSIQHFKKNETLYQEGEVPQMFHCLISGKVKIYKDGIGGRTQIVRVIKPVEYFGYRAYFANQNYVTSAAAFESSTVCLIPIEMMERWIMENRQLALFFIRQLAIEVGNSDQRTVNLTQKHIRGREDLANMSNMTTSNAIRTLSAFAQEKIIAIDGKKIKLIDEECLERINKIG